MFDNIVFTKKSLSDTERKHIIKKSFLKPIFRGGIVTYNNIDTKNFNGGLYIQIDHKGNLKITGSVHKYFNYLHFNRLINDNRFNLKQAKETIFKMLNNCGIELMGLRVRSYEIGLNIGLNFEPTVLIQSLKAIDKRRFYINPKYHLNTHVTTLIHTNIRVIYKAYNKTFEQQQKQRKPINKASYIIRLERVNKRLEKLYLIDFLADTNLNKIFKDFKSDLSALKFSPNIEYKGGGYASQTKVDLARNIYLYGTKQVLENCKQDYKIGHTSTSHFRTQREFLRDWHIKELFKKYKPKPINEVANFQFLLNAEFQELTKSFNKNW